MTFTRDHGQAAQVLHHNREEFAREGYAVVEGCNVTTGTGDREVDVGAGTVIRGDPQSPVDVPAQTVTIPDPSAEPNWVVLYPDVNGDVQLAEGPAQAPNPADNPPLKQKFPTPPAFADGPETIIGAVYNDPDSGGVLSEHIDDRQHDGAEAADSYNAREATFGSVDAGELFSESVPTLVRLFKDGSGNAVAIARDSESVIDSGSNHAAVIQSAIDYIFNNHATDLGVPYHHVPVGWIDCGGATFTLTQQIQHKDRVGIRNATLDASGNTGFVPYNAQPTGSRDFISGLALSHVQILNSGDSNGMDFTNPAWSIFYNVIADGHAGRGINAVGSVGCTWDNVVTNNNDGTFQWYFDGNSIAHSNFNYLVNCDIRGDTGSSPTDGVVFDSNGGNQPARANIVHRCNFEGDDGIIIGNSGDHNILINNWFEGSSGINVSGGSGGRARRTVVKNNHVSDINVNYSDNAIIEGNSHHADLSITIQSNAIQTRLRDNILGAGSISDSGTRTIRSGWGENAGDPNTTGQWNGNGYEGAAVVDTTNNVKYVYRGGTWV